MTTTANATNPSNVSVAELDSEIRHCDGVVSAAGQSRARHARVESAEYEWTTPLNLPGLIALLDDSPSRAVLSGGGVGMHNDDLIESEDGDVSSAFQLPGGLKDLAPRR